MPHSYEPKVCNTCKRVYSTIDDFLENTERWRICDQGHLWFNCSCGSTNIIIKGKYDWYDPETLLSKDSQSIFNLLGGLKQLPHIPTYVMKIEQLIDDETTTSADIARAIKQTPIFAAKILNTVNSSAFAKYEKIEGLEHAISYIGRNYIKDYILVAILNTFSFKTKDFNPKIFWEQAFLTGALAEFIGKKVESKIDEGHLYVAGALANLGKIVQAMVSPKETDELYKMINNPNSLATWEKGEQLLAIPKHTLLGEIGGVFWGIPPRITEAIMHHHIAPESIKNYNELTLIIALANQLSHWLVLRPHMSGQDLVEALLKHFNLHQKDGEEIVESILYDREARLIV